MILCMCGAVDNLPDSFTANDMCIYCVCYLCLHVYWARTIRTMCSNHGLLEFKSEVHRRTSVWTDLISCHLFSSQNLWKTRVKNHCVLFVADSRMIHYLLNEQPSLSLISALSAIMYASKHRNVYQADLGSLCWSHYFLWCLINVVLHFLFSHMNFAEHLQQNRTQNKQFIKSNMHINLQNLTWVQNSKAWNVCTFSSAKQIFHFCYDSLSNLTCKQMTRLPVEVWEIWVWTLEWSIVFCILDSLPAS